MVCYLTEGLIERGHEVTLFATGDSRIRLNLRYVYEKPSRPYSRHNELVHTMNAYLYAEKNNNDIIHNHNALTGIPLGSICDIPSITTLHGAFNDQSFWNSIVDKYFFPCIQRAPVYRHKQESVEELPQNEFQKGDL